jgi:hypothetical protein
LATFSTCRETLERAFGSAAIGCASDNFISFAVKNPSINLLLPNIYFAINFQAIPVDIREICG